jgi:hypothetical protein
VDTEQKRMDKFRRVEEDGHRAEEDGQYGGLNPKLKLQLNPIKTDSYVELVNLAITREDCLKTLQAEKKRKVPAVPSATPARGFRVVPSTSWRPPPPSASAGRWVIRPTLQQSGSTRSTASSGSSPGPQQQQFQQQIPQRLQPSATNRCFTCGSSEHFSWDCPRNQPQAQAQSSSQSSQSKRRMVQVHQG